MPNYYALLMKHLANVDDYSEEESALLAEMRKEIEEWKEGQVRWPPWEFGGPDYILVLTRGNGERCSCHRHTWTELEEHGSLESVRQSLERMEANRLREKLERYYACEDVSADEVLEVTENIDLSDPRLAVRPEEVEKVLAPVKKKMAAQAEDQERRAREARRLKFEELKEEFEH